MMNATVYKCLIATTATLLATLFVLPAQAGISQFVGGMMYSGTPAFDASSGPGLYTSPSDTIVRTYDKEGYRVGYSLTANTWGNSFYQVNDLEGVAPGAENAPYTVPNGGDCKVTAFDNTAKTATLTVTNADTSLTRYPVRLGSNPVGAALDNVNNLDDAAHHWLAAHKMFLLWAPITDIPANSGKQYTNSATLTTASVTVQPNVEPLTTNNAAAVGMSNSLCGSMNKQAQPPGFGNPLGRDRVACDPLYTSNCLANQVAPHQVLVAAVIITNTSISALGAGFVCDKLDNTRFTFVDIMLAGYNVNASTLKDPLTGVMSAAPFFNVCPGPSSASVWAVAARRAALGRATPW